MCESLLFLLIFCLQARCATPLNDSFSLGDIERKDLEASPFKKYSLIYYYYYYYDSFWLQCWDETNSGQLIQTC